MNKIKNYPSNKFKDFNILVVEDDFKSYYLLESILIDNGAKVFWAKNGEEAIDMVKSNTIHLILMDIRMPVLDGYEASKNIKSFFPDIPIIVQTAYGLPEDDEEDLMTQCDEYISKPINHDKLIELISLHLLTKN